ncbi:hypothetical protein GCM10022631_03450 [Deinococcus rubellus]|uniref:Uncharacterized protein n=1 Tax=Deinococcus rubellus TaxID=1889240 RepID=A0ABY5YLB3_9DEIO|nr:hypothetical protein [Deinococcus rubellus]UWX65137.1 hypothetical protein N0D28_05630 [Deinococcus rubellus]
MTEAKVSSEKSQSRRPARPRSKQADTAAGAVQTAEPKAPGPSRAKGVKAAASSPSSPAGTRPRSASAKQASRSRAATGPGLSDWLSLGLTLLLVTAAAALYQWRGEARLSPVPAAHSQPAPGTR